MSSLKNFFALALSTAILPLFACGGAPGDSDEIETVEGAAVSYTCLWTDIDLLRNTATRDRDIYGTCERGLWSSITPNDTYDFQAKATWEQTGVAGSCSDYVLRVRKTRYRATGAPIVETVDRTVSDGTYQCTSNGYCGYYGDGCHARVLNDINHAPEGTSSYMLEAYLYQKDGDSLHRIRFLADMKMHFERK